MSGRRTTSFFCSSWQTALGRYYLTTSRDLDDLREKFTFTIDSLCSYELGINKVGKAPKDVLGPILRDDDLISQLQQNITDRTVPTRSHCHS